MSTAQGIVKYIKESPAGRGTAYNFCLEDGTWYGNGFEKLPCSKGDMVKFTYTANGNFKNVDKGSMEVIQDTRPSVVTAPTSTGGTDWDAKDKRITFLACRKDAVELVKAGVQSGALKLPAKNGFDVLVEAAMNLSNDLYVSVYGEEFPVHDATAIQGEGIDREE